MFSAHTESESNAAELAEDQVDVYINGQSVLNSWTKLEYNVGGWDSATWQYNASQNAIACPSNFDGISGFIDSTADLDKLEFWVSMSRMDGDDDVLGAFINATGTQNNLSSYVFLMEAGGWAGETNPAGEWTSPGMVSALQQKGSVSGLYQIVNKPLAFQSMSLTALPSSRQLYWSLNGDTNIHVIASKERIQVYVNNVLQIDYISPPAYLSHGSFGFFTSSQPAYFKNVHYIATLATYDLSFDANLEGAQIQGDTDISGISTKTWKKNLPTAYHRSYKFLGWNTKPDGTGTDMTESIAAGKPVNVTADTKLYAQWEKIPFVIDATPDNDGHGSATVSWPDYDYTNKNFKVYQSADNGSTWNSVGVDYRDVEQVRCLQIYPHPSAINQMKAWVEDTGYGQGIVKIDAVSQEAFNASPSSYLQDNTGTWKYDVIYIGTWDAHNFLDLNTAARDSIERYIQSGHGVIFGHDNFSNWAHWGPNTPYKQHDVFNTLLKYCGATFITPITLDPVTYEKTKVRIKKNGLLVNYPNFIGTVGTELAVPPTHVGPMKILNEDDVWVEFSDENLGMTPAENVTNSYISIHNNTAILSTGHSNGQATTDEQKMLANLIFYMNQLLFEKAQLRDASAQDVACPEILSHTFHPDMKEISLEGADHGSTYLYYAESYDKDDTTSTGLIHTSNTDDVTVETGLKHYVYMFSSNAIEDANTVSSNGVALPIGEAIRYADHAGQYFHVIAQDNAGNTSDVLDVAIPEETTIDVPGIKRMSNDTKIFDQEFSFTLYDKDMKEVSTTSNDETGAFEFASVPLSKLEATTSEDETSARNYKAIFYAREDAGSDENVIYDESMFRIDVEANDADNDGALSVDAISYKKVDSESLTPISEEASLAFTNTRLIVMPDTGEIPWCPIVLLLAGSFLVIASFGTSRRKAADEERKL